MNEIIKSIGDKIKNWFLESIKNIFVFLVFIVFLLSLLLNLYLVVLKGGIKVDKSTHNINNQFQDQNQSTIIFNNLSFIIKGKIKWNLVICNIIDIDKVLSSLPIEQSLLAKIVKKTWYGDIVHIYYPVLIEKYGVK